jgi:hypothetical protein
MQVTIATRTVAIVGLLISLLLWSLQFVAVIYPRDQWTIENVYGGTPGENPEAYFAWNQGAAWADTFFWLPLQIVGSAGMLLGQKWGFLLSLMASVPFCYSAIWVYIWDQSMGFAENTLTYWVVVFSMWPLFGIVEGVYVFVRLLCEDSEYHSLS